MLPDGRVDYPPREEWIEGQTATFKAAVSPAKAVTWEWSVYGPGKISLASWDTASVILNGTGSLTVTVVAKVGGKEAGRAEVTLPVTVAKDKIQAAREYQAGRNEWNAARRDRAVMAMERAASLDPGNPAIGRELARMKAEAEKSRAEDARKRAVEVWNKAAELQKKEKYEEALEQYREGLKINDDKAVRDHVKKLEDFIADRKRRQEQASADARARAEAIWRRAAELQKGKRYEEALEKYREGLANSPDPVVEEHVRKLEDYIARMKKQSGTQQPQPKTPQQVQPKQVPTPDQKPADKGAGKLPAGWKSVTVGNVSFGIPSSWNGKTMKEHDVEQLHVYWQGSFDNPVHGVSGGVTKKYGEAKKELRGARTVSLGGAKVLRADEDGAVNLLFPPLGGNRGVALVLFRGKGGKQETLEAILKTVTVK